MGQRENMKTPNTAATSATGEPSEPSSTAAVGTGGTAGDIENENENKGDLSDVVGRVGRFSWTVLAYEVVAMFSMALHNLAHSQTSLSDKDHWCRLPDPPGNTTLDEWKSLNIPREPNGMLSRCRVFVETAAEPPEANETLESVPCTTRDFNVSQGAALSVVKQWDLTCEREWMFLAGETAYLSGSLTGLAISGLLADKYGRKTTVCVSSVLLQMTGLLVLGTHSFALFACLRFFVSASISAVAYTSYILLVEVAASEWRALYGTFVVYGFIAGAVVDTLVVGQDRGWRHQQIVAMLPTTLLLAGYCVLPESAPWLLAHLRRASAIARTNQATPLSLTQVIKRLRVEPVQMLRRRPSVPGESSQCGSARRMQEPGIAEKSLWELLVILTTQYHAYNFALGSGWFACSIAYYSIALDTRAVSNLVLLAVAAIVPVVTYGLIVRLGRKDVLVVFLRSTSISCMIVAFLPKDSSSERSVALVLAWLFVNGSYTVLFLYSTELYPTVIRALGVNLGAALGQIGTIIAPIMYRHEISRDSRAIPYMVLCVCCGVSGFLVSGLPEAREGHLPELVRPSEPNELIPTRPSSGRSKKHVSKVSTGEPAVARGTDEVSPKKAAIFPWRDNANSKKPKAKRGHRGERLAHDSSTLLEKSTGSRPSCPERASEGSSPFIPAVSAEGSEASGARAPAQAITSSATSTQLEESPRSIPASQGNTTSTSPAIDDLQRCASPTFDQGGLSKSANTEAMVSATGLQPRRFSANAGGKPAEPSLTSTPTHRVSSTGSPRPFFLSDAFPTVTQTTDYVSPGFLSVDQSSPTSKYETADASTVAVSRATSTTESIADTPDPCSSKRPSSVNTSSGGASPRLHRRGKRKKPGRHKHPDESVKPSSEPPIAAEDPKDRAPDMPGTRPSSEGSSAPASSSASTTPAWLSI